MVSLNEFIGFPVNKVIQILEKDNIKYRIEENESKLEKYDTLLVIQVKKEKQEVVLVVDKFLLNI